MLSARFPQASLLAEELAVSLYGACQRVAVAGSLRRRCPIVRDIEFVVIPKAAGGLFGPEEKGATQLDGLLSWMKNQDGVIVPHPEKPANGPRMKRFLLKYSWHNGQPPKLDPLGNLAISLELYIVPKHSFGYMLAIRTGPEALSKKMVTVKARGGFLPNDCGCKDGRVWQIREPGSLTKLLKAPQQIYLPEEKDFFELCNLQYMEPDQRHPSAWKARAK